MRKLFFLMMILGAAGMASAARTTKIGRITAAETWADTILVTGDVICTNAVVTIQPGTVVWFDTTNQRVTSGESDASHIHLIVKRNGAINALGTAPSPILFTTRSANKIGGKWGEIDLMAGIDTVHTAFQYCVFECGQNAFDFRSASTSYQNRSRNRISIDRCTIRSMDRGGIYITSAGSPIITNCLFYNLKSSCVFAHGAQDVFLSYSTVYNVGVGIINVGEPSWGWNQTLTVNHVTIDSVNGARSSSNQWWTGMGIYCAGDIAQRATLNLTNTLVANVANFTNQYGMASVGLYKGNSTVTEDYNCWYRTGQDALDTGNPAVHDKEADPRLVSSTNPTLGLAWGSPCLNAANDGTHIGAWQGAVGIRNAAAGLSAPATAQVTPNPFTERTVFTLNGKQVFGLNIFSLDGKFVKACGPAATRATWDGTDQQGSRVKPGVYVYRIMADGQELNGQIMLTR
jgi:hypothetical protein